MRPPLQLTGKKIGRLTVIRQLPDIKCGNRLWLCRCECGKEKVIAANNLNRKARPLKSCGCLKNDKEFIYNRTRGKVTHGFTKHPIYSHWLGMIKRCCDEKNASYRNYGARGIFPCRFIKSSPRNLLELIGDKPTNNHSIDRIDVNLGYNCGSCEDCKSRGMSKNIRWATTFEQARNRRTNTLVTIDGITKCAVDWANVAGITPETFYMRMKAGNTGRELLRMAEYRRPRVLKSP